MTARHFTIMVAILLITVIGLGLFVVEAIRNVDMQLAQVQAGINEARALTLQVATSTQKQIASTQSQIAPLQDFARRQGAAVPAPAKTQDQVLTSVVAKVAPSVVSVVISKAVPQLEVDYVNPFGDDPNYRDIGIRIPVYRQKGTTLQRVGAGSGFLVTHSGYIVTNRHVVADTEAQYTVLLSDGSQKPAQVAYRDGTYDLAVIKIEGNYPTIATLGDSSRISLGQTVIAIGNALGEYSNSVSVGIISGLNRSIDALDQSNGQIEKLTGVIQTDAAINPGNSGGPLIDLNATVAGINVATVAGSSNIGFAIPINTVRSIIQNVVK